MSTDVVSCFACSTNIDDAKCVLQCTICLNSYHNKCVNIDLRGFHMKRSIWKCNHCVDVSQGAIPKRFRFESENGTSNCNRDDIMLLVHSLIDSINGLKEDVKILLSMNKNLRDEIKSLIKHNQEVSAPATVFPKSFSEVIESNNVQNKKCGTIAKKTVSSNSFNNFNFELPKNSLSSSNIQAAKLASKSSKQLDTATTPYVPASKITVEANALKADDDFVPVSYKKKRNIIRGSIHRSNLVIKAEPRSSYIYVGNLDVGTSETDLSTYLENKLCCDNFKVESLPKRENAKSIAYKVTVDSSIVKNLMDASTWPENVIVKKFYFLAKKGERLDLKEKKEKSISPAN
ncbi:hypothetical protein Zmor_009992 [Zophobas morio]|uniref:PHD-type domain-containing protein n=1 Tax=Zophobas morio TaxID=2755281 RepID=A0AA38IMF4_9CUCU|nr:hypothetical protein Zmor_009992 [Zophobas morio]